MKDSEILKYLKQIADITPKIHSEAGDPTVNDDTDLGYKCGDLWICLLYTSPSPRDRQRSRMPSSA